MTTLAITGGTGFVGARLIEAARAAGHHVRALTRRPQPPRDGVEWIEGGLDDEAALDRLVADADATIHVAGVVSADRAGFAAGNVEGTRAILAAVGRRGGGRFVHVSSLAAREPALSNYGWSKAEAEALVTASAIDWVIVRPPGIYGPGDLDQLDLFRAARFGVVPLPPRGRLSLIAVDDLARLLLASATTGAGRMLYEADDGGEGWSHAGFARAIGAAVGRRVLPLHLPRAALRAPAARLPRAADGGPRRLFLPSRLDDRSRAPPARDAVATGDPDAAGPSRHRAMVSRQRPAIAPSPPHSPAKEPR